MPRILVLGGGLSGLHTAYALERLGLDPLLVEARDRLGGRILSARPTTPADPSSDRSPDSPAYDLGPAWFWPGQPRIRALVRELGLESQVFEQYADGDGLVEMAPGRVQRGRFEISMAGSYRLRGGMGSLVRALAERLEAARPGGAARPGAVRLGARATAIELDGERIRTTLVGADGGAGSEEVVESETVVIALPPRVALASLDFEPALAPERRAALARIPTWMASSAKCMALYDEPFWRRDGLSGDAFSQVGPLGEIHDASPPSPDDGPAALFGFFALPPELRRARADELEPACLQQLGRLFGPQAARPLEVFVREWAFDPLTTTADDRRGPAVHSLESLARPVEPGWDGRLAWSGSETASAAERFNGYLEGALAASERTVELLTP